MTITESNTTDTRKSEQSSYLTEGTTIRASKICCGCYHFGGEKTAIGSNFLGAARGAMIMSNIFLAGSFLYLAHEDAGCINEEFKPVDDCQTRVYGFVPIAFLSNIAVISGLISAFCMPVIGAVVDYTNHRTLLGIVATVLLVIIQAVQIGTVIETYFVMAMLQAIAGFLFQILILAVYSFLPYIARRVGKDKMRDYTSTWALTQFSSQGIFLMGVVVFTGIVLFGMNEGLAVKTAQISQSMSILYVTPLFILGWRRFPKMPPSRELPEGNSILLEGFRQNWRTIQSITAEKKKRKSLGTFFLTIIFAEAATNAFTIVANTFLYKGLNMNSQQVGIFFFIVLVFSLPGTQIGSYVTRKTNPNASWRLSMLCMAIVADVGVFLLDTVPKESSHFYGYVWGGCVGIFIGWFYPTENYLFSLIVPKEQEAELAGFFVYCSQIIGWLPPLMFSIIVENGYNQKWGVLAVTGFHFIAIFIISFQEGPWSSSSDESIEQQEQEQPSVEFTAGVKQLEENKSVDDDMI